MQEPLEQRVRRLERSNRRLKIVGGLLALLTVACGSGITSIFALVKTQRLAIIDASETVRISMSAAGGGQIVFMDDQGQVPLDAATLRRLVASAPTPKAD